MPSKILVGYWKIRALVAPIQYLLEVSGLDYELKLYEFKESSSGAIEEVMASWLSEKPTLGLAFPNLPYLIDSDGDGSGSGEVRLTQSLAIMRYVARKAGLLGVPANATPAQIAQLDLIEQQANDLRWNYIYYGIGSPIVKIRFPEGFPAATVRQLQPLNAWLKGKRFVMGELCYVDMILFEVLEVFKMINPDCLKPYPDLEAYRQRLRSLPALERHLASPRFLDWPVLGPPAHVWGYKRS